MARVAVVTLGERGLVFDDGRQQGRLPALPVKAVDTKRRRRRFPRRLRVCPLRGMELGAALQLATVAAGLSVQNFGGRLSVPELASVLEAMRHARGESIFRFVALRRRGTSTAM